MKYEDAEDLLYQTKWKTETCSQGAQCWCRMVVPVKPIVYDDCNSDGLYVAGSGALNKRSAKYSFQTLWDSINRKKYPWSSNPWVWVIEFKRI
jgi:hypothetical protein